MLLLYITLDIQYRINMILRQSHISKIKPIIDSKVSYLVYIEVQSSIYHYHKITIWICMALQVHIEKTTGHIFNGLNS